MVSGRRMPALPGAVMLIQLGHAWLTSSESGGGGWHTTQLALERGGLVTAGCCRAHPGTAAVAGGLVAKVSGRP
jgi:hypothetical protein